VPGCSNSLVITVLLDISIPRNRHIQDSTDPIPTWSSEPELVAVCPNALVVKVVEDVEGRAAVTVWQDGGNIERQTKVFSGELSLPSGNLRVSDAVGEQAISMNLPPSNVHLDIFVNELQEASKIDLVVS
jgi:hypothetical protein